MKKDKKEITSLTNPNDRTFGRFCNALDKVDGNLFGSMFYSAFGGGLLAIGLSQLMTGNYDNGLIGIAGACISFLSSGVLGSNHNSDNNNSNQSGIINSDHETGEDKIDVNSDTDEINSDERLDDDYCEDKFEVNDIAFASAYDMQENCSIK